MLEKLIKELKKLQLKNDICGTLECLRNITDLTEVDKVCFNSSNAYKTE